MRLQTVSYLAGIGLTLAVSLLVCTGSKDQEPTSALPTPTPTPSGMATPSKATPTPGPTPDSSQLTGGVVAVFDVLGEQFRVWVTNPSTIEQLLALRQGASAAKIPNGRIIRGPGRGNHNAPWSWHLDPEDIQMAEFTIEVCDATPSYVEQNLEDFVTNVKRYCPWSASLVEIQDYR